MGLTREVGNLGFISVIKFSRNVENSQAKRCAMVYNKDLICHPDSGRSEIAV